MNGRRPAGPIFSGPVADGGTPQRAIHATLAVAAASGDG
jgi:hypothetical protein